METKKFSQCHQLLRFDNQHTVNSFFWSGKPIVLKFDKVSKNLDL